MYIYIYHGFFILAARIRGHSMSSMYGHTPRNTEEQLHSQLQQLRVSLQETASQQQRLVGNLTAQGQKQDMRLQECECQKLTSLTVQSVDGSSDWPMVTAFIQRAAPKGLSVFPFIHRWRKNHIGRCTKGPWFQGVNQVMPVEHWLMTTS